MALATASLSRPYVLCQPCCQPCSASRPLHAGKSLAASASASDASSDPNIPDMSGISKDAADYRPDPQNAKSAYSTIALAAGSWKPYQVFAIGGIARILCMMHSPTFASMFAAPFAEYIGQANAVAVSMLPGGLLLLKLGDVIQKRKWHESNTGLAVLTISCVILMLLLRAF